MKKISIIGHGVVGKAVEKMLAKKYEILTYDPAENDVYPELEINNSELVIIAVPTNENPDGSCDVSIVESAVSKIDGPPILIKSTIVPGTTDYLSKKYKQRICFSPEYIGESKYYHPYWVDMVETPFLIVGGKEQLAEIIFNVFEPLMGPTKTYYHCSAIEAEVIKYMENCFFATKVTFVNEFFDICKTLGANWHKVREGWLLDSRINKMHTSVFKDNRGFSGKCYPKDLSAIIAASIKVGYKPQLLKSVKSTNKKFTELNK